MIRFSHYKNAPYPIEKINRLYRLLMNDAKYYEASIADMDNAKMRSIVQTLSTKSDQFASALYSRMHGFVEVACADEANEPVRGSEYAKSNHPTIDFTIMEKLLVNAYRDVLNQPFFDTEFRQLVNFQLSEMLYLFMYLKLMHSCKVRMY